MFNVSNFMIIILIILTSLTYWATSNVCRYNFAIDKKTKILNIIAEDIDPNLVNAKVYYFSELNCNKINLDWDIDRVIKNFKTLSIIIYQELNTDIKGDPN